MVIRVEVFMNYRNMTDDELIRSARDTTCELTIELAKRLAREHLQERFSNAQQYAIKLVKKHTS